MCVYLLHCNTYIIALNSKFQCFKYGASFMLTGFMIFILEKYRHPKDILPLSVQSPLSSSASRLPVFPDKGTAEKLQASCCIMPCWCGKFLRLSALQVMT